MKSLQRCAAPVQRLNFPARRERRPGGSARKSIFTAAAPLIAALLGLLLAPPMARGAAPAAADAAKGPAAGAPQWWRRLRVRDLRGEPLNPEGRWFVVIFLGQECPVSNASIPVLNRLAAEFRSRGFAFVGAYVDAAAELGALRAHAADYAVGFPTADDRAHRLVEAAGATYTPEVAVFAADGARLYGGRIDDRVGESGAARPAATHEELRAVLTALASGTPGPFPGRTGYGCAIAEAVRP